MIEPRTWRRGMRSETIYWLCSVSPAVVTVQAAAKVDGHWTLGPELAVARPTFDHHTMAMTAAEAAEIERDLGPGALSDKSVTMPLFSLE